MAQSDSSDELPGGVRAGHWSDREGWTGATVVLCPEGSIAACEVRGGGPGTRESDLLSPASAVSGADAILLTGGSAFGLAAADGASRFLAERGRGVATPAARVPLVSAAVIYDLMLGSADARPGAEAGYSACEAAAAVVERGSVGAGTGATAGKLLGADCWTKGGLGFARIDSQGAAVAAVAAVNPFGEVLAEDGSVLAGAWRDGRYERTADLLRAGVRPPPARESTTLVCLITDARLTKTQAWLVARAASAGVARSVSPSATAVDGDVVFCVATGAVEADPFSISVLGAEATAAAIRDAIRTATGAPGCPAASER
ncbi:MAG: P1 family peptidase [Thermoleophilaceae bacterium]